MSEATEGPYKVARVSVVVKGADTLVREYVLEPGEVIFWHHHTEVSDFYYGLEGTTLVETREPPTHHELEPGGTTSVTPPTVHRVSNPTDRRCRFLLVQGVGHYDFVKAD
jgi:quercetin dioxygenase-like cupin family protein